MPHFGLIDGDKLGPEASELMRARLHIRSARLRLAEGRVHEGVSTLFDALQSSFRWYVISPARLDGLDIRAGEDVNDERVVCEALKRSGVIDATFDFGRVCDIEDKLLEGGLKGLDHEALAAEMESVMEALGVIPFDEDELPPEHPGLNYTAIPK